MITQTVVCGACGWRMAHFIPGVTTWPPLCTTCRPESLTSMPAPGYHERMADPTQLDRIEAALANLTTAVANLTTIAVDSRSLVRETLAQELQMANVLDPIPAQITALTTEVTNETTVNASAIALLNGLSGTIAQISAQLQTALANAADPAQVAAIASQLGTLATTVHNNAGALAAAVTANTPAAPVHA